MIAVQGLHKSFGHQQVLHDISLEFHRGSVYGLVGANGAGKTTLYKCIAGLEGYEGHIASDIHPLKDHLGWLPTQPFFFPWITGEEYLRLHCHARRVAVPDLEARNIFELPLGQYARTYSTGMKKKLALLAILLVPNEVYILDEPFNGVDIQSNILIDEIIARLRSLDKTVLISSHIFSTLSSNCSEIYVLEKGRIVRRVAQAEFEDLEKEMKNYTVGNAIDRLGLK